MTPPRPPGPDRGDVTAPSSAEEALRRSEERYRVLFETIPQPVMLVEFVTFTVLAVNAAALRQYGYTREEFSRLTLHDLRAPDSPPTEANVPAGAVRTVAEFHRRRDGSLFPVEVVVGRLDFEGRPARLGIVTDVTERRRVDEALRSSEARFRTLLENTADALLLVGRDGTILYRSPSATRILGYTSTERLGAAVLDLIHPEDRARAREALACAMAHPGETLSVELRAVHENRSLLRLECMLVSRLDEPAVRAVVVNYRDVTEARATEEALRASERRLRALVESISGFLTLTDREGMVLYATPPVTQVLGYEPAELVGRSALELMHPDDVEPCTAVFARCLAQPGLPVTTRLRYRHKDGTYRTLESEAVNRFDEPAIEALVTYARDTPES